MKLNKTFALAALVVTGLFAGSITLQAQDNTNTPPVGAPPGGMRARPNFDAVARNLELTDAQKPKVKVVFEDMQQKQRELRQDASVPQTEKRAKLKEIREAATAKLKDILTADQLAKWEKIGQGGPRQRPQAAQPASGDAAVAPKVSKD